MPYRDNSPKNKELSYKRRIVLCTLCVFCKRFRQLWGIESLPWTHFPLLHRELWSSEAEVRGVHSIHAVSSSPWRYCSTWCVQNWAPFGVLRPIDVLLGIVSRAGTLTETRPDEKVGSRNAYTNPYKINKL